MVHNVTEQLARYPHQDPLGFEQILVIENYNLIFNNLLKAYGRLMYIKRFSPESSLGKLINTNYCVSRRREILAIKNNFYHCSFATMLRISPKLTTRFRAKLAANLIAGL
jgi:hypothetical protein